MLTRPSFAASTQRPPVQQRSVSHGSDVQSNNPQTHAGGANPAFSRLSHVRSASGPYPGEHTASNFHAQRRNVSMVELTTGEFDVDLDEARPKKRARFETGLDVVASPQAYTQDALHHEVRGDALGSPMRPVEPLRRQGLRRDTGENAARRADGLTPPAMATRLPPPKNVADFSPWHGQHPEDILNERAIKEGYSEKGPSPNQNESNTARLTIWPSLSQKNNIALHTLSLLYTQVLEKRQVLGRCTAPSSFKPPPRVTVTDTKREAWLRDLASPAVPLRRQSRTIPHGIRGKLLLEQCVTKSVPLQRAVWLAKCVGANELRAFKRKGVSGTAAAQGEAKWIRDWTLSVEQFLNDVIEANGQQDWLAKMEYAIKLVTTIYTENLLEKDHFLDWIVASLSTASDDHAPSWMLLAQLYWDELVSFSRRGRLLAKTLLAHLDTVSSSDHDVLHAIKEHLRQQLAAMLTEAQECLILPDVWPTRSHLLKDIAATDDQLQTAFDSIDKRNMRLLGPTTKPLRSFCHPSVRLYHMLDRMSTDIVIGTLAQQCIDILPETTELVAALLSWTSTRYKPDISRVVLVEQLIHALYQQGLDTDTAVLSFLSQPHPSLVLDADKICLIIANLVRHGSFSPGRYLKWLITSGATATPTSMDITRGLLLQLPNTYLPQHLSNTRISLLSRLHDIDFSAAQASTKRVQDIVEDTLADSSRTLPINKLLTHQPQILKSDLADWAKQKLSNMGKDASLTAHTFCIYRSIFEACCLLDGIVSLIEMALSVDDFMLFASVSDTINLHAIELAAITSLEPILDHLSERYRVLRTQQPLERTFIVAARDLFSRMPNRGQFIRLLRNDLTINERQNLSVVCSPASDNLIGMHAGKIESDDEIEAVFASGNTMDHALMQRVFLRIMQRAEKQIAATTNPSAPCRWLTHIRLLDQATFEHIATSYLRTFLSNPSQRTLPRGISTLVAADCSELTRVVACISDDSPAASSAAMLRFLASSQDEDTGISDPEQYHLQQQRQRFCQEHPDTVNNLLVKASTALSLEQDAARMTDLVVTLQAGGIKASPSLSPIYETILTTTDQEAFGQGPLTVDTVISGANALNAPLCAAWLSSHRNEAQNARSALLNAVMSESQVWPILLQASSAAVVKELYTWALENLLKESNAMPDEKHIAILDVTHAILKQSPDQILFTTIAARLKAAAKTMSTSNEGAAQEATLRHVTTLLHMIVLCTLGSTEADAHMQGRAYIVMALCAILSLPTIGGNTSLVEYITDVAGTLIDRLSGEVVAHLSRNAQSAGIKQSTITSCFGNPTSPDSWLALANAAQSGAGVQSRALLKTGTTGANLLTATRNAGLQQQQAARMSSTRASQQNVDLKYTSYPLRRWEVMPDPTPVIGENDSSISLALFGARKA